MPNTNHSMKESYCGLDLRGEIVNLEIGFPSLDLLLFEQVVQEFALAAEFI